MGEDNEEMGKTQPHQMRPSCRPFDRSKSLVNRVLNIENAELASFGYLKYMRKMHCMHCQLLMHQMHNMTFVT